MYLSFAGLLNYMICTATAVTFFSAYKRETEKQYPEYLVLSLSLVIALLFNGMELSMRYYELAVVFNTLKFIGVVTISPSLLMLYLRFSGHISLLKKRMRTILFVIPFVTVIASWTNPIHHLFWTSAEFTQTAGASYISFQPGIAFWINSAFAYIILAAAAVILLRSCFKKPSIYRRQGYLMAGGLVFAVFLNALVIFNIVSGFGDFSIIAFALPAICHYWALYIYKPTTMIRLARSLAVTHIQNPIVIFDDDGLLIDANTSAEELFKLGDNYFRSMTADIFTSEKLGFAPGGFYDEKEFIVNDGESLAYTVYDKQILDKKGRRIGRVIGLHNITSIKSTVTKLEFMAMHDHLTMLYNRTAFMQALHNAPQKLPTAVISFCISNIDVIRKIYGYDRSDAIICIVANVISKNIGEDDICGRISSDEFCVALCGKTEKDAVVYAMGVAEEAARLCGEDIYTGISYGVAVKLAAADNIDIIVKKSNTNMYHNSLINSGEQSCKIAGSIMNTLKSSGDTSYFDRGFKLAKYLAEKLPLTMDEESDLNRLILMHDIGLMGGISYDLNEKKGMMSNEEWEEMKLHTLKGHSIASSVKEFTGIADAILAHHERYDGLGYPNKLSGEQIPKLARIFIMIDDLCGTPDKAYYLLERYSGSKYDPEIANALNDCHLLKESIDI